MGFAVRFHDGAWTPVVRCDRCMKLIESMIEGNVCWTDSEDSLPSTACRVLHKKCTRSDEADRGNMNDRWMPLVHWVKWALFNEVNSGKIGGEVGWDDSNVADFVKVPVPKSL